MLFSNHNRYGETFIYILELRPIDRIILEQLKKLADNITGKKIITFYSCNFGVKKIVCIYYWLVHDF